MQLDNQALCSSVYRQHEMLRGKSGINISYLKAVQVQS